MQYITTTQLSKLTGVRSDNIKRMIERLVTQGVIDHEDVDYGTPLSICAPSAYVIIMNCDPTLIADWVDNGLRNSNHQRID